MLMQKPGGQGKMTMITAGHGGTSSGGHGGTAPVAAGQTSISLTASGAGHGQPGGNRKLPNSR
jgi:hypothetical protein